MRRLVLFAWLALSACVPKLLHPAREPHRAVPASFGAQTGTAGTPAAPPRWSELFVDPQLRALIGVALENNQELNVVALEVDIAQTEVRAREGEFLPQSRVKGGAGLDKVGRYTSQGVSDEALGVPEHLPDFKAGLFASWEIDVWAKLRNATRAATMRYLASIEGKNFTITLLVQEIAHAWFELRALDAQLAVLEQNLALQKDALEVVRAQKEAAKVTELAVKRFEAEVLQNESRRWEISQRIVATENHLNVLAGRFPQRIERAPPADFLSLVPPVVHAGLPSQLLSNRPDIRQAELELAASALDVDVAKAYFYPSLDITAGLGLQSFDLLKLVTTPASIFYSGAIEITAPLFNRKAIAARYQAANALQQRAVFQYERAILKGYAEAGTQLAAIENLEKRYRLKEQSVARLDESTAISTTLFASARADYAEVLLTRREALERQMELIETRKEQLDAVVNLYQALGGGWH